MLKVVVLEKIKKNWDIGSVVSVKNGFARNYLIPTGKAKIATKDNIEDIMKKKASLEEKDKEFIKKGPLKLRRKLQTSISKDRKSTVKNKSALINVRGTSTNPNVSLNLIDGVNYKTDVIKNYTYF
jgi:large subunit ribosomal protein L9